MTELLVKLEAEHRDYQRRIAELEEKLAENERHWREARGMATDEGKSPDNLTSTTTAWAVVSGIWLAGNNTASSHNYRQRRNDMTTAELVAKYGRAQLGIDGNCGFSLLGGDLQEGEAEFVEINDPRSTDSELVACKLAHSRLKERLDLPGLSYYFGPSHPYGN
jgi:hypothetical protein